MSDHPSSEDVLKLFESLPGETPSRGSAGDDTKSWTTGAYAQGNFRGFRTNTHLFPSCTEVMCRFLRRRAPKRTFAALAIFQNLQSKRRRDVNNDGRFCNILVPLTLFQAGGVWIELSLRRAQCLHRTTRHSKVWLCLCSPGRVFWTLNLHMQRCLGRANVSFWWASRLMVPGRTRPEPRYFWT